MEEIIMNLISYSGEARSYAMEAIELAKTGDINAAKELIEKSVLQLAEAHKLQSNLIQFEVNGDKVEISMLLIHAQDHLMTTILLKDLANEIVDLYKKIDEK
ncbi:PTS lactose/cellobiose transporter subunit IIA [Clostridium sp.]|uniref:PTS lactose/cellobiose transporter subunit IIA n=1 Tax=Clostridium sp. TaxID=1506 RepID=UPI002626002A|nr:PTS lactose/cellobiose transporter subunit IIA [Clostridium sp.]